MKMNKRFTKKAMPYLLLLPHLLGMTIFYLIPFLWGMARSLQPPSGIGFDNYVNLMHNDAFKLAVWNTLLLTLLTVPLLVIVSFVIALYAYRFVKSGLVVIHSFVVNYAVPTASIVFIWTLIFGDFGFINRWLSRWLGITSQNWLDGPLLFVPIVTIFIVKYAAYPMIIFLGALQSLPRDIYEAASIDGASGYKKLVYLTLPLLKPELLFVATLGFFFNFRIYKEAYMLFGAYPPKSIYLIQHFMNNQFQKLNLEALTASAVVMTVVISTIIYLLIRVNRQAYVQ